MTTTTLSAPAATPIAATAAFDQAVVAHRDAVRDLAATAHDAACAWVRSAYPSAAEVRVGLDHGDPFWIAVDCADGTSCFQVEGEDDGAIDADLEAEVLAKVRRYVETWVQATAFDDIELCWSLA